jgi:O-antigen ligase
MFALPTWGLISGSVYAPLGFGLAVVLVGAGMIRRRTLPTIDPTLAALAALFAGLSWASVSWSVVPDQTVAGALQITVVLLGALLLAADGPLEGPGGGDLVIRAAAVGLVIGPAVVALDIALGFPLMTLVHSRHSQISMDAHYNRGLCHLALIVWPILFGLWQLGYRRWLLAAVVAVAAALVLGSSLSARLALGAGLLVWLAAWRAPRATALGLAGGLSALVLALPWLFRLVEHAMIPWVAQIKASGVHRLEIWDYMTARVLERPWLGWGLHGAKHVPITPEQLASYRYVNEAGIYPHNQWLQLWVELGLVGVVIGLALVTVVLLRLAKLPEDVRPFAFAAVGAMLSVSMMGIEMTSDSWWAAIAATAFLFAMARPGRETS